MGRLKSMMMSGSRECVMVRSAVIVGVVPAVALSG